ncbi:MAG: sulfate ABC transporter substrate-binding protein [Gallionellaceae bacterium]|nr:sulfate ABC transporter substrate-binding protein [Gallionellaceae bacterium]
MKLLVQVLALAILVGVAPQGGATTAARSLTLGAYTTPREAYGKAIIPAFQRYWKQKTGQEVRFQESYLGSGAQARAIVGGFEADVAALSLEADIDSLARAGLIQRDWRAGPSRGMVSRSVVVLAVRKGNPKAVRDWNDLRHAGLEVLTPNVRTSGGAKWNVCALYGAAMRGNNDTTAATALLSDVLRNVTVMDKGARESMINFEKGVGDVAITYENEVLVGRKSGETYEYVVPRATILIENPVAVVDKYADKHGNRDLAEAFVAYLATPEAQHAFAEYGLRPVDAGVAKEVGKQFPAVRDLFTIRDLGGWGQVDKTLFGPAGVYERAMAGAR